MTYFEVPLKTRVKRMKYCKHTLNAKFPHRILYKERRPKRLLVKVPRDGRTSLPFSASPRLVPDNTYQEAHQIAHPHIPFSRSSQNAFDSVEDITKKQVKNHPSKLPSGCRKTVRPGANCPNFSGCTLLKAFLENSNTHFCQLAKENPPRRARASGKQWP